VRRWAVGLVAAAALACPSAASADGIVVTIDPSPAATNNPSPTFTFGSDDPAALLSCRIDTAAGAPVAGPAACLTPPGYTPPQALTDGDYVLTVDASDLVTGATGQATRAFIVDRVAPDTTIGSGPSGPTNDASPAFALTASEPSATFECKLNGPGHETDDFGACGAYSGLADGDYTFAARATDAAGNTGAPATQAFTVDTVPPAAPALSGSPAGFTFSGEAGARYRCRLDGPAGRGAEADCVSPRAYPGLAPGAYTLLVHAVDAAGNAGPDAALSFSVAGPPAAPAATPSPAPVLPLPVPLVPRRHVTVVARPGLADVRVRLPGSAGFVALTTDRALPVGTLIDARRGSVQLIAAPRRQLATFDGAIFRVTQPGSQTVLTLARSGCRAVRLTGAGRGAFAVRGRYSTTTVRSARWVVRDSCAGTLTRVLQGVAAVRDSERRRTLLVRAGRRYLARAGN
jgi:hypothetical protein